MMSSDVYDSMILLVRGVKARGMVRAPMRKETLVRSVNHLAEGVH